MSRASIPQVLVTGRLWLGADGARSIGTSMIELLKGAKQEIIIVAYRLTVAVPEFVSSIESALARGCYVRIVRDRANEIVAAEENYIENLLKYYSTVSVWDFKEISPPNSNCALHAKMVIVDRSSAIIGSANFSKNGMLQNHEIAVRLSGAEVKSLGVTCDQLIENGMKEGVLIQRRKNES